MAAFVGSVEDLLQIGSQRTRAEVTTVTGELGLELGEMMGPLFRHHLWLAIQRQRAAMAHRRRPPPVQVSIGFVDLVGFTPITAAMGSAELLEFMRQFHSRTYDVVTRSGGRVVKHIGDEIMFTSGDLAGGCEIAFALIEAFDDADSLPRGGLAPRHGRGAATGTSTGRSSTWPPVSPTSPCQARCSPTPQWRAVTPATGSSSKPPAGGNSRGSPIP